MTMLLVERELNLGQQNINRYLMIKYIKQKLRLSYSLNQKIKKVVSDRIKQLLSKLPNSYTSNQSIISSQIFQRNKPSMNKNNSVLNFREIIIHEIQDLESDMKRRSNGRNSSFDKNINNNNNNNNKNSNLNIPPLPHFAPLADQDNELQKLQKSSSNTSKTSYNIYSNKHEDFNQNQSNNKPIFQQFIKPQFTNPVSLSQNKSQKDLSKFNGLDLSRTKLTPSSSYTNIIQSQKENFNEGECTFRENQQNNNNSYFKGMNLQSSLSKDNNDFGIDKRSKKLEETVRFTNDYNNNKDQDNNRFTVPRNAESSIQSYSPLQSRMEGDNDFSYSNNYNQSKMSPKKDYFSICIDPNSDRQETAQNTFKNMNNNSYRYQNQNDYNIYDKSIISSSNHKQIKQSGIYNKQEQPSYYNNRESAKDITERLNKERQSQSPNTGFNYSPLKKTPIQNKSLKNNTLQRFPSQVSFSDSLRSYSPQNKLTQQQLSEYSINKNNLKKIVLFYEFDKVKGLYNLESFIKLFRELGLINAKTSDKYTIKKEIEIVEELWRVLKFSSNSTDYVSTNFVYQILLIVIDSKIHKLDQAANLMDTLCKKEYEKYSIYFERDRDNASLWLSSSLIETMRNALLTQERNEEIFEMNIAASTAKKTRLDKLFDHQQYLKTDLNERLSSKEKNIQNIQNPYEDSYNKRQNNFSKNIDGITESQFQKDEYQSDSPKKQIHEFSQDQLKEHSYLQTDRDVQFNKQMNVHERLFQCGAHKQKQRSNHSQIKEQAEQQKLQKCTFQPKINKNTNKILQRSISSNGLRKDQDIQLNIQQDQQPIQYQIKGYKENLQRMEQARQQREYKEKYWDNQRIKCQNIAKSKSPLSRLSQRVTDLSETRNNSPTITTPNKNNNLTRQKSTLMKEKPLLYVDINISKGKQGKIAVYQGDQPQQLAEKFSKIYNLSLPAKEKLVKKLKDILNMYYAQLYEEY